VGDVLLMVNQMLMRARTCPSCGYRYSIGKYYRKIMFNFSDSCWQCEKCGSTLTYNGGLHMLVIGIAILPMLLNYPIVKGLMLLFNVPFLAAWVIFAFVFVGWMVGITSFEYFVLVKEKREK